MLFSCNLDIFSCIIYQNSKKKKVQFAYPLHTHWEHFVFNAAYPLHTHLHTHSTF